MLASFLLLVALSTAHAEGCAATASTGLVSDLSTAVTCNWRSLVGNSLVFLQDKHNAGSAKYEAHAAAEKIRAAEKEGKLSAADAAKLQDALAWVWHRSDEFEKAWDSLGKGRFQDAKDQAHALANRIRATADSGFLNGDERTDLLDQASRLWELADQLSRVEKLTAQGKMSEAGDLARKITDVAGELTQQGWLSAAQAKTAAAQANALAQKAAAQASAPAQKPEGGNTASVPYYNQYDNGINPGGSCQNTSLAMVLNSYGVKVTPDQISNRYGTTYAQDPNNLARVFNTYASEAGIPQRLRAHTDGTESGFNQLLDAGKPVIVHGFFTSSGHVVVATGRTGSGYTVNDPAGAWSQQFKGGYKGSYNGKGVTYGSDAFLDAVATYDGSTRTTLWYHEVYVP